MRYMEEDQSVQEIEKRISKCEINGRGSNTLSDMEEDKLVCEIIRRISKCEIYREGSVTVKDVEEDQLRNMGEDK